MPYSDGYKVSGSYGTTSDPERTKRMAFHDMHTLVIDIEHPDLSWDQREMLRQVGEKFYGKLKKKS
jgi:hypothetical protein